MAVINARWLAAVVVGAGALRPHNAPAPMCTIMPGRTIAVVRVEKDTTLSYVPTRMEFGSASHIGEPDSMLATPGTPMHAGRARVLQLDSATRSQFTKEGITGSEPRVLLRAAPYRADCRTIRWTSQTPFVVRGEVGYIRATVAPREQWINNVPVLVIPDAWYYPYPRRRGLAFRIDSTASLASAHGMFSFHTALEMPRPTSAEERIAQETVKRERAIVFARTNRADAKREPLRRLIREAVLRPDYDRVRQIPSRLRGTYRVDLQTNGDTATWFFRTTTQMAYSWPSVDTVRTTADVIASPFVAGYQLLGHTARSPDSIPDTASRPADRLRFPLVWFGTNDRPTAPGNDGRRVLMAVLEFTMAAAPERFWDVLEPLVPPMTALDSAFLATRKEPRPRGEKQPRIPLAIRLDESGGVRGDASLTVAGRTLRVVVERVDTASIKRPF